MDNRRLLLAAFLCMALVVVWSYFFPAQPPELAEETGAPVAESPSGSPASPQADPNAPPGPAGRSASPSLSPGHAPAVRQRPIAASREETVTLVQGDTRAIFSNRGAQLVSLEVGGSRDQGSVELVRRRREGPYPYGLTTGDRRSHPLNEALFAVQPGAGGKAVTFRYSGPQGSAEKTFKLTPEGLIEASVAVPGHRGWGVVLGPGVRSEPAEELNGRIQTAQRGVVYMTDRLTQIAPKEDEVRAFSGRALEWIGVEDAYFLSVAIPREGLDRAVVEPVLLEGADSEEGARIIPVPEKLTSAQKEMPREYRVVLKPSGDAFAFGSYWGAKEYERLAALPFGLEKTIRLGTFGFLARALLVGLRWIHDNIVPNYGWAIVLMTVLIRLLLLPLTHSSMKSMKKMQELNPKMQAIKERYRTKLKDKQGRPNVEMQQKQNQEIMALYKENKVNPAGGCLPILLQLPILFAFYNLLSTAIELRGAPWILWIRDMSVHDPYYVLPILMGATQFLQVKLAPQAGDPMQRRLFLMMPIVFTFLFLPSPSGLVLYWLTNNVLTILQQWVYNRLQGRAVGESTKTAHQRG